MSEAPAPTSSEAPKTKKEKKAPPAGLVIPPKKPKLSKAERRALQEQQRAAKQQQQGGESGKTKDSSKQPPSSATGTKQSSAESGTKSASAVESPSTKEKASAAASGSSKNDSNMITLVSHLTSYHDTPEMLVASGTAQSKAEENLHPAVVRLGHEYASGQIRGGNKRCRAMLQCFSTVLQDYQPPADATVDIRHSLDQHVLKPSFSYWTLHCRPHSVSMGNSFSFLKTAVAALDREWSYDKMCETLLETMEQYQRERIEYADQAIAVQACQKLDDEEVILVYGHSEVTSVLLQRAAESKKHIRVIVVDSRPLLEGRILLEALRKADIECTYILLNALTYVLQDVTKVLLGASALMSDGSILGRVGTACVALAAHAHHIPVLVCAESYKISNRVQLESLTHNELGNPENVCSESLEKWKETPHLQLLNLLYDLTPAAFVSGIVTELGIVPPTSVAVLLREMNPQDFKSS